MSRDHMTSQLVAPGRSVYLASTVKTFNQVKISNLCYCKRKMCFSTFIVSGRMENYFTLLYFVHVSLVPAKPSNLHQCMFVSVCAK